jgi:hypothetical protein
MRIWRRRIIIYVKEETKWKREWAKTKIWVGYEDVEGKKAKETGEDKNRR